MNQSRSILITAICSIAALDACALGADKSCVVSGELKQWHKVTLTFTGPDTSENAGPNPFRDYRLNVTFTNGDKRHIVPGYYAGRRMHRHSSNNRGISFSLTRSDTGIYSLHNVCSG
jgi:hypothetical protein